MLISMRQDTLVDTCFVYGIYIELAQNDDQALKYDRSKEGGIEEELF